MSNIDATLAERGSRYGEFVDHAEVTQNIKGAMANSANWAELDDDQRECLEMVAHKVGRILNGDPDYIDSWTDIIGYTRLVEKRLIAEQATVKEFMKGPPKCDDPKCDACHPRTAAAQAPSTKPESNTLRLIDLLAMIAAAGPKGA